MALSLLLLRSPLIAATGLALTFATGPVHVASASVAAPALVGIEYLNGPFARVGWTQVTVATVHLDQTVAEPTAVTLSSDGPHAQVPATVTVPTGQSSVGVPVTGVSSGSVTLSAHLNGTTIDLLPRLEVAGTERVPALDGLEFGAATVAPGDSVLATVSLDFLAPPGGTQVDLSSSDPDVVVPETLMIASDRFVATVLIQAPERATEVTLTASLNDESRQAILRVVEPVVPDTSAPQTRITKAQVRQTKRRAKFRFASTESGLTFECRMDKGAYRPCTSPQSYNHLKKGRHVFKVRARDGAGNLDPSPARAVFSIEG